MKSEFKKEENKNIDNSDQKTIVDSFELYSVKNIILPKKSKTIEAKTTKKKMNQPLETIKEQDNSNITFIEEKMKKENATTSVSVLNIKELELMLLLKPQKNPYISYDTKNQTIEISYEVSKQELLSLLNKLEYELKNHNVTEQQGNNISSVSKNYWEALMNNRIISFTVYFSFHIMNFFMKNKSIEDNNNMHEAISLINEMKGNNTSTNNNIIDNNNESKLNSFRLQYLKESSYKDLNIDVFFISKNFEFDFKLEQKEYGNNNKDNHINKENNREQNYYFKSYKYFVYRNSLNEIDNLKFRYPIFKITCSYSKFLSEFLNYFKLFSILVDNIIVDNSCYNIDSLFNTSVASKKKEDKKEADKIENQNYYYKKKLLEKEAKMFNNSIIDNDTLVFPYYDNESSFLYMIEKLEVNAKHMTIINDNYANNINKFEIELSQSNKILYGIEDGDDNKENKDNNNSKNNKSKKIIQDRNKQTLSDFIDKINNINIVQILRERRNIANKNNKKASSNENDSTGNIGNMITLDLNIDFYFYLLTFISNRIITYYEVVDLVNTHLYFTLNSSNKILLLLLYNKLDLKELSVIERDFIRNYISNKIKDKETNLWLLIITMFNINSPVLLSCFREVEYKKRLGSDKQYSLYTKENLLKIIFIDFMQMNDIVMQMRLYYNLKISDEERIITNNSNSLNDINELIGIKEEYDGEDNNDNNNKEEDNFFSNIDNKNKFFTKLKKEVYLRYLLCKQTLLLSKNKKLNSITSETYLFRFYLNNIYSQYMFPMKEKTNRVIRNFSNREEIIRISLKCDVGAKASVFINCVILQAFFRLFLKSGFQLKFVIIQKLYDDYFNEISNANKQLAIYSMKINELDNKLSSVQYDKLNYDKIEKNNDNEKFVQLNKLINAKTNKNSKAKNNKDLDKKHSSDDNEDSSDSHNTLDDSINTISVSSEESFLEEIITIDLYKEILFYKNLNKVLLLSNNHYYNINLSLKKIYEDNYKKFLIKKKQKEQVKIYSYSLTYAFYGYSNSQFRNKSTTLIVNAELVRDLAGKFKDKNVSKYGSRLGQTLTTTSPGFIIDRKYIIDKNEEVKSSFTQIDKRTRTKTKVTLELSDGVGYISAKLAKKIQEFLKLKNLPSCFQARFMGCKGVWSVKRLRDEKIVIRKSQKKFDSDFNEFEVCDIAKYRKGHLNRQIIVLLSTLGVEDKYFEDLLDFYLTNLRHSNRFVDFIRNREVKHLLNKMIQYGVNPDYDIFMFKLMKINYDIMCVELKNKNRILVKHSTVLKGILDEYDLLEENEAFACLSQSGDFTSPDNFILTGDLVVTRCPCHFPGDVRKIKFVDFIIEGEERKNKVFEYKSNNDNNENDSYINEEDEHPYENNITKNRASYTKVLPKSMTLNVNYIKQLINVLIFPSKGKRNLPNEMSGGDLDGDDFFVFWDETIVNNVNQVPCHYFAKPELNYINSKNEEEPELPKINKFVFRSMFENNIFKNNDNNEYVIGNNNKYDWRTKKEKKKKEEVKINSVINDDKGNGNSENQVAVKSNKNTDYSNIKSYELIDFFVNYGGASALGKISNMHLIVVDKAKDKAKCEDALVIAELASRAVDAVKTGEIIKAPEELLQKYDKYPHYMNKQKHMKTYQSDSLLGRIYDKLAESDHNIQSYFINKEKELLSNGFESIFNYNNNKTSTYNKKLGELINNNNISDNYISNKIFNLINYKNLNELLTQPSSYYERNKHLFQRIRFNINSNQRNLQKFQDTLSKDIKEEEFFKYHMLNYNEYTLIEKFVVSLVKVITIYKKYNLQLKEILNIYGLNSIEELYSGNIGNALDENDFDKYETKTEIENKLKEINKDCSQMLIIGISCYRNDDNGDNEDNKHSHIGNNVNNNDLFSNNWSDKEFNNGFYGSKNEFNYLSVIKDLKEERLVNSDFNYNLVFNVNASSYSLNETNTIDRSPCSCYVSGEEISEIMDDNYFTAYICYALLYYSKGLNSFLSYNESFIDYIIKEIFRTKNSNKNDFLLGKNFRVNSIIKELMNDKKNYGFPWLISNDYLMGLLKNK